MLQMHQLGNDPLGVHELFFSLLAMGSAGLVWVSVKFDIYKARLKKVLKRDKDV